MEEKKTISGDRRILIVDDDKDFADSIYDILQMRDYSATIVNSENGIAERVKTFKPHVALLDIRLGNKSGIDLIKILREIKSDIICVMVTAYASVESALEAMQHGAYDYLRKPINIHDLLGTLERCFEKVQLEQEKVEAQRILFRRLCYEEGLAACSHTLLTNTENALRETLYHLMTASNVKRVYIYENYRDPMGRLCMRQVNFVSFDGNESGNRDLNEIPYLDGFQRWKDELSKGRHIAGNVAAFPKSERDVLFPQNVFSLLLIPIIINDEWYGFMGFDDTEEEREWSESDIRMLRTAAEMIGEYLNRQRSHEAVKKSEEQYRLLANSIKDVIWTTDLSFNITYITPSVEKLLGYTVEEILTKKPEDLLSPSSSKRAYRLLDHEMVNILSGDFQPTTVEVEFLRRDGTPVIAESTVSILYDSENKPSRILGVTRDITERKRSEAEKEKMEFQLRQSQKMEAIGTLAGGIAHDFNNILSGIFGYTELAMSKIKENNPVNRYLQEVIQAAGRAKELVRQVLTLSRQQDHEMKFMNIGPVIDESVRLLSVSLPTNIAIQTDISADSDVVKANPVQIHQIIMNLCTNAVHAMKDTGGVLSISLREVDIDEAFLKASPDLKEGRYIKLEVGDTGHGISDEIIDKIFDPFFTTKDKGEGSGLGLSVIHGIISNYGGAITASSKTSEGTVFEVYLPLVDVTMDEVYYDKPEPIPEGNERILLVDDEEVLVNMLGEMLQNLGYKVVGKASSVEAMEEFKSRPEDFDLVITDQSMPNMTGVIMSGKMIELRPDIPIILCTGFSEQITMDRVKAMGISDLLYKPITTMELAKSVRNVLDKSKKREEKSVNGGCAEDMQFSGKKILVADDMDANRKLIDIMLKKIGCEAEVVSDGSEVIERLREKSYDMILMDINMPVMSGIEATKILRTDMNIGIPVVAMTGEDLESNREQFLDAGINDFLMKPVGIDGLKVMLRKWTR